MKRLWLGAMTAAVCLAGSPCAGLEVKTGRMLGQGYDARAFYVRSGSDQPWRKTYAAPQYAPEAQGRLMNLRIAQALFHDEWLTEFRFDPDAHTQRVIEALADYKAHGILAITASLQGGNPGYNREVPSITREIRANHGPGKGALISAFNSDGSLKPAWLSRLRVLQRAMDANGMVLILTYFYNGQDEVLNDPAAIQQAVRNATDWLIDNDCRNVLIEIANEIDVGNFEHDEYIFREVGTLIKIARERFAEKRAAFRLPISASTGSSMTLYPGVRHAADYVTIHGNGRRPAQKGPRVLELYDNPNAPGPIVMNEDDAGRDTLPETLARELLSCDEVFKAGGSWGYMPWRQLQMFPFPHVRPGSSSSVRADMPVPERDAAYFKAVLEHVQQLVLRTGAAGGR